MTADGSRAVVDAHDIIAIDAGWTVAATAPGAAGRLSDLDALAPDWVAARVPGTAAGALRDAGRWTPDDGRDFDAEDWWFRVSVRVPPPERDEELVLRLDGVATAFEVFLDGEPLLLAGTSMFERHVADLGARTTGSEQKLVICCRALGPLLGRRRTPRQRWRQRLVDGGLRFHRTMLLGRAPGIAPGPAAVGPWRPVVLERRRRLVVERCALRPALDAQNGVLRLAATLRPLGGEAITAAELVLDGPSGEHRAALSVDGRAVSGELIVPRVARWWPHTHGEPARHHVELWLTLSGHDEPVTIDTGYVGFRSLTPGAHPDHDILDDGLDLHVNGVRVFARGALWTPLDFAGLAPEPGALRAAVEQVREAGMNMLRLPGTGTYESAAFHDLCDELGVMVWQDLMFANLDYPIADESFRATVQRELESVLAGVAGRPSLTVVCGNSEVEQQVAMLGLDPALGRGELFAELIPAALRAAGLDVPYVPSAPCGGDLPFRPGRGVAHYFGVGGYMRPLSDVRAAGVRFAAECLAIANVPGEHALAGLGPEDPTWKQGVPADAGTDWDFDDVRDHYLQLLYATDPGTLRRSDPERYLELSRAVSGEVMAEVFGEWRRAGSPCGGALVLWLRDLRPGAGWGLLDSGGCEKVVYHHLRRALAPISVWMVDEGLGGIAVHVANDGPAGLVARLRVALYRDGEQLVGQGEEELELVAHAGAQRDVEAVIGHFADVTWAYRFGPPQQDVVVASLEADGTLLAQAFRFPVGRPLGRVSAADLGLEGTIVQGSDGTALLTVRSRRVAWGVRLHIEGFAASDDAFCVEPGGERVVVLRERDAAPGPIAGWLSALNLDGRVPVGPAG